MTFVQQTDGSKQRIHPDYIIENVWKILCWSMDAFTSNKNDSFNANPDETIVS